ncbi:hypothetical protein AMTR_s00132p00052370 [Amborella trichopoda]|uniref:Uncharacterized protein n=1 Tax=Amborella trichopoda TaxID=13333 RepID=W1NDP4_AMBTC|nr:hypothetical protein AMTR_s00132p00052370 [Amborella trichopoda]
MDRVQLQATIADIIEGNGIKDIIVLTASSFRGTLTTPKMSTSSQIMRRCHETYVPHGRADEILWTCEGSIMFSIRPFYMGLVCLVDAGLANSTISKDSGL